VTLSLDEIREFFTEAEIKKAFAYYRSGKVKRLEILEDSNEKLDFFSFVEGGRLYKQNILVIKKSGSKKIPFPTDIFLVGSPSVEVEGDCTCPVGYNCKHVASALIKYIKEIEKTNNSLNNWLRDIEVKLNKKELSEYSNDEHFLVYRLFEDDDRDYSDDVIVYKSKYLKNGNISRGSYISNLDNFLYSYHYDDIKTKEDREVIEIMRSFVPKYSYDNLKIKGRVGYYLIQALLETKRAFFKREEKALSMSDKIITIDLEWKKYKNGYKLVKNIKKRYYILNTTPPLAIDTKEQTVLQVQSPYSVEFLKLIEDMPAVEEESLARLFFKLQSIVDAPLPIPPGIPHKEIKQEPTIELELSNKLIPTISLYCNYEDIRLSPAQKKEKERIVENNKVITLHRDLQKEQEARETLINLGFRENIENNIVHYTTPNNSQNSLDIWENFLKNEIATLENQGWIVNKKDSFSLEFKEVETILVESKQEEEDGWFSLSFDIEVEDKKYPLVPLISHLIEEFDEKRLPKFIHIELEPNSFVKIPTKTIQPILKTLYELFDKIKDNELKISKYDAHLVENIDEGVVFKGKKELLELSKKLKNFKGIKKITPPKSLQANLREYQKEGLNWLNFLHEFGFGGILADDMGLGKTIQTLALLSYLKEQNKISKPVLIVMPTSLLFNWKDEINKFAPHLSYLVLHGKDRAKKFDEIEKSDIILTTYQLVARDIEQLKAKEFSYVILDESQKIKNPKTKMAKAVKELTTEYKLALSGTPIENNLEELWSIFSFLMPGFLGDLKFFKNYYQKEIENNNSIKKMEQLRKKITPFILRRTKEVVAKELPSKTEIIKYAKFDTSEARLYESVRVAMEKKVKEAISKKGLNRSHIAILDALLKLRQICCHPSLLPLKEAKKVKKSAKLELLFDLVDTLLQENKKILLFSQFTSMLDIIEDEIIKRKIPYTKLTGSTTNREAVIKEFKKEKTKIFLISLKAGGVGLNLTEADTIIHYDPWWNPAVENQATDRAYRIGQDKKVFVYKLIVENTIEQKILELQAKKAKLQKSIYENGEKEKIDGNELLELLKS